MTDHIGCYRALSGSGGLDFIIKMQSRHLALCEVFVKRLREVVMRVDIDLQADSLQSHA